MFNDSGSGDTVIYRYPTIQNDTVPATAAFIISQQPSATVPTILYSEIREGNDYSNGETDYNYSKLPTLSDTNFYASNYSKSALDKSSVYGNSKDNYGIAGKYSTKFSTGLLQNYGTNSGLDGTGGETSLKANQVPKVRDQNLWPFHNDGNVASKVQYPKKRIDNEPAGKGPADIAPINGPTKTFKPVPYSYRKIDEESFVLLPVYMNSSPAWSALAERYRNTTLSGLKEPKMESRHFKAMDGLDIGVADLNRLADETYLMPAYDIPRTLPIDFDRQANPLAVTIAKSSPLSSTITASPYAISPRRKKAIFEYGSLTKKNGTNRTAGENILPKNLYRASSLYNNYGKTENAVRYGTDKNTETPRDYSSVRKNPQKSPLMSAVVAEHPTYSARLRQISRQPCDSVATDLPPSPEARRVTPTMRFFKSLSMRLYSKQKIDLMSLNGSNKPNSYNKPNNFYGPNGLNGPNSPNSSICPNSLNKSNRPNNFNFYILNSPNKRNKPTGPNGAQMPQSPNAFDYGTNNFKCSQNAIYDKNYTASGQHNIFPQYQLESQYHLSIYNRNEDCSTYGNKINRNQYQSPYLQYISHQQQQFQYRPHTTEIGIQCGNTITPLLQYPKSKPDVSYHSRKRDELVRRSISCEMPNVAHPATAGDSCDGASKIARSVSQVILNAQIEAGSRPVSYTLAYNSVEPYSAGQKEAHQNGRELPYPAGDTTTSGASDAPTLTAGRNEWLHDNSYVYLEGNLSGPADSTQHHRSSTVREKALKADEHKGNSAAKAQTVNKTPPPTDYSWLMTSTTASSAGQTASETDIYRKTSYLETYSACQMNRLDTSVVLAMRKRARRLRGGRDTIGKEDDPTIHSTFARRCGRRSRALLIRAMDALRPRCVWRLPRWRRVSASKFCRREFWRRRKRGAATSRELVDRTLKSGIFKQFFSHYRTKITPSPSNKRISPPAELHKKIFDPTEGRFVTPSPTELGEADSGESPESVPGAPLNKQNSSRPSTKSTTRRRAASCRDVDESEESSKDERTLKEVKATKEGFEKDPENIIRFKPIKEINTRRENNDLIEIEKEKGHYVRKETVRQESLEPGRIVGELGQKSSKPSLIRQRSVKEFSAGPKSPKSPLKSPVGLRNAKSPSKSLWSPESFTNSKNITQNESIASKKPPVPDRTDSNEDSPSKKSIMYPDKLHLKRQGSSKREGLMESQQEQQSSRKAKSPPRDYIIQMSSKRNLEKRNSDKLRGKMWSIEARFKKPAVDEKSRDRSESRSYSKKEKEESLPKIHKSYLKKEKIGIEKEAIFMTKDTNGAIREKEKSEPKSTAKRNEEPVQRKRSASMHATRRWLTVDDANGVAYDSERELSSGKGGKGSIEITKEHKRMARTGKDSREMIGDSKELKGMERIGKDLRESSGTVKDSRLPSGLAKDLRAAKGPLKESKVPIGTVKDSLLPTGLVGGMKDHLEARKQPTTGSSIPRVSMTRRNSGRSGKKPSSRLSVKMPPARFDFRPTEKHRQKSPNTQSNASTVEPAAKSGAQRAQTARSAMARRTKSERDISPKLSADTVETCQGSGTIDARTSNTIMGGAKSSQQIFVTCFI